MTDLTLPAFEMDCRDWLVLAADEAGVPEDAIGGPILAVLSTIVIDEDICEATGALTVGLLDDDEHLDVRRVAPGAAALELLDSFAAPDSRRFVMPSPGGQHLALVAEFVVGRDEQGALGRRVETLMASFRWQAA